METGQHGELSASSVDEVLAAARPTLEARLRQLSNPYHNSQHANEVAGSLTEFLDNLANPNLLTPEQRLLLIEAAWRHDDGHSGKTYRQDVYPGVNVSNEEHAIALLKADFDGKLAPEHLKFMTDSILATSFGQSDPGRLHPEKQHYYRTYKPQTDAQRLLVLADVSGILKGWDQWVDESFRLLEESPQNAPISVDDWIKNRMGFVQGYIRTQFDQVKHLFTESYSQTFSDKIEEIIKQLTVLNTDNQKRASYQGNLDKIKQKS